MLQKILLISFLLSTLITNKLFTQDCASPIPITCGVPYTGTTVGASNEIEDYSCSFFDNSAGDNIHTIVATSSGELNVFMTKHTGADMEIGVLSACDEDSCIDRTSFDFGSELDLYVTGLTPGKTYYVVVDGDEIGDEGGYDLVVDCGGATGTCAEPIDVEVGVPYYGLTQNGEANFDTYTCGIQNEFGREKIHRVLIEHPSDVTATISDLNGEDLDIHWLNSCDPTDCVARDDDSVFVAGVTPGIYYVVVDGFGTDSSNQGTYTLNINMDVIGAGRPGTCLNPIDLTCGVQYSGNTGGYFNNIDDYSCSIFDNSASEVIYSVIAPPSGNLTAILTKQSGLDMEVAIMDGCNEDSCIDKTSLAIGNSIWVSVENLTPGKRYYIVVDGDEIPDTGAYTVQVDCYKGDCLDPVALTCGVPYNGTTESGGQATFDTYPSCAPITDTFTSYEKVHIITLIQQQDLTATLTNLGGDLDVFIMNSSSCNPSSCVAYGDNTATATNLPAGTYYVVVDGISFSGFPTHGPYTLTMTCGSGGSSIGTCTSPIPISCGTPYNGTNNDGQTNFGVYGCSPSQQFGREKVHELNITDTNDLAITLTGLSGVDLDLHVLNTCDPNDCAASGDSVLNVNGLLPGTYYIVVDGAGSDTTQIGSYILNVDCTPSATPYNPGACSELFFSEYIEGAGQDKVIEIYNSTTGPVNLSSYSIALYANGSSAATSTIPLSGTVGPNSVFVVANDNANSTILTLSNQTTSSLTHNGNDAIALFNGPTMVDVIGVIGADPGSAWSGSGVSTSGQVLVRKQPIQAGIGVNPSSFDPSIEWDSYLLTDLSKLGKHQSACVVCSGGQVTASVSDSICPGEIYIVNGNQVNTPGTYTDSSYAQNGCDSITTINLTVLTGSTIVANSDVDSIEVGGTINFNSTGSNGVNYTWDFGDGFNSSLNPVSHTFNSNGTFNVVLTGESPGGCSSSDTLEVIVGTGISGIDETITLPNVLVYPNPAQESITIDYSEVENELKTISLFNFKGEKVRDVVINGSKKSVHSVQDLPKGVYIIRVITPNYSINVRLVKS